MVQVQSITSDEYKAKRPNFKILYSIHPTPIGNFLIGIRETDKSVLYLCFVPEFEKNAVNNLEKLWPYSEMVEDTNTDTLKLVQRIFSDKNIHTDDSITVLLKGTEFQLDVWKALLAIPPGGIVFYEDIAQKVGRPKAIRAVGTALSKNPITYLVPCHRVKGKSGSDKFSCGVQKKHFLQALEDKHKVK